jgi:outer membrane protein assembly factor BamB
MRAFTCSLLIAVLVPLTVQADWTRFRGPNGQGTSDDSSIPTEWTKTKNIAWKQEIPGAGHSSPIIVQGKIFLQSASVDGTKRSLFCLNEKTGKVEWVRTVAGEKTKQHKKSSLASGTPAADSDRVYVVYWTVPKLWVYSYDFTGKELWKYELGGHTNEHGAAISPVVHEGRVYLNYDQDGASEVVCLNAKTGEKVWSMPRKAHRTVYTSPMIHTLESGKTELIVTSTTCLTGYNPETGKLNWNWEWTFAGKQLRTTAVPLLTNNVLIQFSGDGGGSRSAVALDLSQNTPKPLWEIFRDTPNVPAGVIRGEHVYLLTDSGLATCIEVKTGRKVWQERALTKAVSASTVLIGDKVLAIAEDGKAVSFRAVPSGFEKLSESDVGEAVFATPAIANGKLFIRGANTLFAIGK